MGRIEDARRATKEAVTLAGQVLERRPGHMQALRAQALATSPMAVALLDEMNLAEALRMSDLTVQAWREFVRLDPGNTISWSNLGVGLQNRSFILVEMGRPTDAAAALRQSLELERGSPPNQLLYDNMAFGASRLANLEANRGNVAQAAEALTVVDRLDTWVAEHAPAGSYVKASRPVWTEAARVFVLPFLGEDRRAVEQGRAVAARVEQLQPTDARQRLVRANVLRGLHNTVAQSAYELKDYPTAERSMAKALELHKQVPILQTQDKRDYATEQAFMALVLARLGRTEEAQKLAAEALRYEREISLRNRDSQNQRLELAGVLYVAAVAGLGDGPAQLAEAAAIVQKLPPEMLRLKDVALWQARIAEERTRRRT
jgi:tetratricopeptide (TPR) repeat protein